MTLTTEQIMDLLIPNKIADYDCDFLSCKKRKCCYGYQRRYEEELRKRLKPYIEEVSKIIVALETKIDEGKKTDES